MISLLRETDTDDNSLLDAGNAQCHLVKIGDSKNASLLEWRVSWCHPEVLNSGDIGSLTSAQKAANVEQNKSLETQRNSTSISNTARNQNLVDKAET